MVRAPRISAQGNYFIPRYWSGAYACAYGGVKRCHLCLGGAHEL